VHRDQWREFRSRSRYAESGIDLQEAIRKVFASDRSVASLDEVKSLIPRKGSEAVRADDPARSEIYFGHLEPMVGAVQKLSSGARDNPTIESVSEVAIVHVGSFYDDGFYSSPRACWSRSCGICLGCLFGQGRQDKTEGFRMRQAAVLIRGAELRSCSSDHCPFAS